MAQYGSLERAVARALSSSPALKKTAKYCYQRLVYIRHKTKQSRRLADKLEMVRIGPSDMQTFFGYYDKTCWSPDGQTIVTHLIDNNQCVICVAPIATPHILTKIGETTTWNLQQGAMTSWLPDGSIIYNTREQGAFVARRVDITGGEIRIYNMPVQSVSPQGTSFISLNYSRLQKMRPDYGYLGVASNFPDNISDTEDGLWSVDTDSGDCELLHSLQKLKQLNPRPEMEAAEHKVNHAHWSPSGEHFVFMHRFFSTKGKFSRLYVCKSDGTELKCLADNQVVSHYDWLDATRILAWARDVKGRDGYSIYDIETGVVTPFFPEILDVFGDGHPNVSPSGQYVLFDTYPGKDRCRRLYVIEVKTGKLNHVATLFSQWKNEGVSRCDLHPRWSKDEEYLSIDSDVDGLRGHYIVRIEELLGSGGNAEI